MSLRGALVSPVQADAPALDAWTRFLREQTPGKGALLILCSFLRLIIHSTASSCYRCPALPPRSSHWGLTLKKNTSDGHLPREEEKEALWTFPHRWHSLLI